MCDMCLRNYFYIEGGENMFAGDTETQLWARYALHILVRRAQARRTITFSELTDELELPLDNAIIMGKVCRHIIKTLAELERRDDWEEGEIPHITSIVLRSDGTCSPNMCRVLTGDYRRQPSPGRLQIELDCSYNYENWDAVLAALPY